MLSFGIAEQRRLLEAEAVNQLALLHGFTGAPESWANVVQALPSAVRVYAPCLPGHHGRAAAGAPREVLQHFTTAPVATLATAAHTTPYGAPFTPFWAEVERLAVALQQMGFERGAIAGYSLGGRLALALSVRYPQRFSAVVAISAHLGLEQESQRAARRNSDAAWLAQLTTEPLERFVDAWQQQGLFATQQLQPEQIQNAQRAQRLQHTAAGLAHSLSSVGLAEMPDLRPALLQQSRPVTFVVGALDDKYVKLAQEACALGFAREVHCVPHAGHNLLLESPQSIARVLERVLP